MVRTGTAVLPLHTGKTPRWLFTRMVKLSRGIAEVIIHEYGSKEFLRYVSDPFWFQAFCCVIGFDWHSSGTTTTACGALKEALDPEIHGLCVVGGKGRASRRVVEEINKALDVVPLSDNCVSQLVRASRLSAKVDSSCVQDGYTLYHHTLLFTDTGDWAVVQQGMKPPYARRYHWLSDRVQSFVEEPHTGICCEKRGKTLDLTSKTSEEARRISLDLVRDGPKRLRRYLRPGGQALLTDFGFGGSQMELRLPSRHQVLRIDLSERSWKTLEKAYELQPERYEDLVALRGMGAKSLRALALVSSLVYGAPLSWKDPAKYSFAHGGKDRHPYPVDRKTYDHTIQTLRDAIEEARAGKREKLDALKRLSWYVEQV